MKPWLMLSTQVARTQPEVVTPVRTSVSTPAAVSEAARLVPKNELGYCLVTTNLVLVRGQPFGEGLRRLALDETGQRRRLAEEHAAVRRRLCDI